MEQTFAVRICGGKDSPKVTNEGLQGAIELYLEGLAREPGEYEIIYLYNHEVD